MRILRRLSNIMRFGIGAGARERKRAHKEAERQSRFNSELWKGNGEVTQRQYASYDEYLSHQAQKLDKIVHRLEETENEDFAEFKRRFDGCAALAEARSVLCLGARLGTEVKALHSLGYFAVGIDLNPGPENHYVLPGDFHHLVFPDGSVDAVYTNTLDHVFDLEKMIGEVKRLLRPGGLFVTDVLLGYEEGFIPGAYESTHWRKSDEFIEKIRELGGFSLEETRDLGQTRRDHWKQAVLRKSA